MRSVAIRSSCRGIGVHLLAVALVERSLRAEGWERPSLHTLCRQILSPGSRLLRHGEAATVDFFQDRIPTTTQQSFADFAA